MDHGKRLISTKSGPERETILTSNLEEGPGSSFGLSEKYPKQPVLSTQRPKRDLDDVWQTIKQTVCAIVSVEGARLYMIRTNLLFTVHETLESLAEDLAGRHTKTYATIEVSYKPAFNVLRDTRGEIYQCFELTPEEQDTFWKLYRGYYIEARNKLSSIQPPSQK